MRPILFILHFLLIALGALAQQPSTVRGRVTNKAGEPLPGANVVVKGSYDGGSANAEGWFSFTTTERGEQVLMATFVGHRPAEQRISLNASPAEVEFGLEETPNELNTVTISAGAFEASDAKKITILRPLDIATTAGANADIFAAIQTLPGTQAQGDQEGLFVRGGAASEARTMIDGTLVQNPFFSNTPDVPARGRFSPFLFKGTSFSSGGYSAQYGQALSSVLVLNTNDLPDSSQTSFSLSAVGLGGSRTQRWARSSLAAEVDYSNLGPLFAVVPQNIAWQKAPESLGGGLRFTHQLTNNQTFKVFSSYRQGSIGLAVPDLLQPFSQTLFRNRNRNAYLNTSYRASFGAAQAWTLQAGASVSYDRDEIDWGSVRLGRHEQRVQGRAVLTRALGEQSSVLAGAELHRYDFESQFNEWAYRPHDTYAATFVEAEVYVTRKLAARPGLRAEHSALLGRANLAPRLSLAYKTGPYSQFGFAFGHFYQNPDNRYLFINSGLDFEKAIHWIANFQVVRPKRTFRAEVYQKNYRQLVRELNVAQFDPNRYRQPSGPTDNSGSGYARGLDLFWRDQQSIKGLDYWVSYAWVDTRRLYQNFLAQATPTFIAEHTVNVVARKYVTSLSTSFNASWAWATGRPYYNPHHPEFLGERTPAFSNLSLAANYLTRLGGHFTVVVLSVTNVLGRDNVFGYRYSPDGTQRTAIGQAAPRFVFLGMFITLK
ncbi:MAG: TonB-dependent receptor [Bernardetiaceae bacterium]|nr:TonB-dependent receptor [Bernardetiaceae bacterium]